MKSVAVAIGLWVLSLHFVWAKDSITWGLVNFDPQNTSRTDLVRAFLSEKLTDYAHDTVIAPIPRIVSEIKSGAHWCWAGALKTDERLAFSSMSAPIVFTFSQRIIIRKSRYKEFVANGPLSLATLLQDKSKRGNIARSRSYSPAIDALLTRFPPSQTTSSIPEALQMLLADRLDYVLEDVGVARAHVQTLGSSEEVLALPFKEMNDYILGRVMCPKNDWGKKVISDINAILNTERASSRYRRIVETYHDDDDRQTIRQAYDDVFLKSE